MTDRDILAIISQGITDGTDLDCTAEAQAREVLRQLRAAGLFIRPDWHPPIDRPQGYRCYGFYEGEWHLITWWKIGSSADWYISHDGISPWIAYPEEFLPDTEAPQ